MPVVDPSVLVGLQKNIRHVRNICILAHVDHGKTTLADSLLASNGIISQRMAGKLRYMDSRQDEQERGITMKSSSISLYYQREADRGGEPEDFLVNLIDSPGHVDFSSEVSTAVRLCDGAIIVVDVVEGVGPQTRACLHQVYTEQLKPVLLLNKIDRLILEKQMSPLDAYFHISQVLEQVNAVLGNIFASDVLAKEDITGKENYESPLEQVDDSLLYFTPASGNVIFCSAYDGWAFTVRNFSKIYSERLEMSPAELEEKLWGDYYYSPKQKAVLPGAQEKAKRPMFVQFVLDNIWQLYETIAVRKDKEKLPAIAAKLGLKLLARDLRSTDAKSQIKTVLGQWLPIDQTVLEMVTRHVPAPNSISDERAARLLFPANADPTGVPPETLALTGSFQKCSASCEDVVVFVSKMVPVHVSQLPQNRPKRLGDAELQARRDDVRKRIEERKLAAAAVDSVEGIVKAADECTISNAQETTKAEEPPKSSVAEAVEEEKPEFAFVAFARVFSGTLRRGMKLYSLSPKHDPRNKALLNTDSPHVTEVTVGDLYLFMGGELQPLDEVPAGNIVGIGGLENSIVKTATLSTTLYSTGFSELNMMATPILRVAIEPSNPLDMPKFMKGLKLLNQSDACVQVSVESSGEHVITTLGEVHMEKCVRDLEENFAKIKVNVSKPIVPFRETIVAASTVDMVNEAIVRTAEDKDIKKKIVTAHSLNKLSCLQLIALPLPQRVVDILERHSLFLKELTASQSGGVKIAATLATIRSQLIDAMDEFDTNGFTALRGPELVDRIWSLGPRQCATNILLNLSDYQHPPFWTSSEASAEMCMQHDARRDYNSSVVNGFQLATSAGPLCEEPMQGVCFVVLQWTVSPDEDELNSKAYGPFSGQVLNTSKDACRMAFQNQPQRLVSPMYSCSIVVNADMLGKMYAVIGRRHGKILSGDLTQGSGNFSVTAVLPVIESFNFAQEIRKQTSGLACPQLMFSHWEIIDIDPFWVPTTEEEITHYGEKADSANRAKLYMDSVRRRKGLYVDEKVVEHAEKQRTLSKNK